MAGSSAPASTASTSAPLAAVKVFNVAYGTRIVDVTRIVQAAPGFVRLQQDPFHMVGRHGFNVVAEVRNTDFRPFKKQVVACVKAETQSQKADCHAMSGYIADGRGRQDKRATSKLLQVHVVVADECLHGPHKELTPEQQAAIFRAVHEWARDAECNGMLYETTSKVNAGDAEARPHKVFMLYLSYRSASEAANATYPPLFDAHTVDVGGPGDAPAFLYSVQTHRKPRLYPPSSPHRPYGDDGCYDEGAPPAIRRRRQQDRPPTYQHTPYQWSR